MIILIFGCEESIAIDKSLLGQENAVWSESIYLRGTQPSTGEKLTENDLKEYAETLRENHIKYAYLFSGPYQNDGHLPRYPFTQLAKESVRKLKAYYPEIIILPWIGGIQNKTVYLGDSLWTENALKDTKRLIDYLEVPGVHVDFEYIVKGNPYLDRTVSREKAGDNDAYPNNVNYFHERLRKLVPDAFISSVVVATPTGTQSWKRKTSTKELEGLVPYVDQLSFLFFDTMIDSQELFETNCVAQVKDIQTLKELNPDTQFLISVGTFVNREELHNFRNLKIESVPNTLKTIQRSILNVNQEEKLVDGISIYCDWQTEESEWKSFRKHWSKKE
ncbi:hypothetical protein F8C76_13540 [Flagellimonas olearia]|uniref:GH18 domain-containing protein n=1 Tax=Flagellimonas olearia TaxID=552546 RepID=A0A6I1DWS2_9FLAO|nr:hypothetical protein [Allomuricauda olearia]KAB7528869.1 hypothetical protein F8C76_13540 [Allomuricauda olearia]